MTRKITLPNAVLGLRSRARKMLGRTGPKHLARLQSAARDKTHWVSPDSIRYESAKKFSRDRIGETLDGDWDGLTAQYDESDFHRAFLAVHGEGRGWVDTDFYKAALADQSEPELQSWLGRVDEDYAAVRESGQIAAGERRTPITVNVGRHGDLLLNDGMHWLSIGKLLGLPRVPVRIIIRHFQWIEFRDKILGYHKSTYSTLLHPDLEWIPARNGHERFDLMHGVLSSKSGTLLDIGCYWGYFCQRFEELGFDCVGVEVDERQIYFLEKLKRANNNRFEIVNRSIFDFVGEESRHYDVVLALRIFHHFIKTEENYNRLKDMLANLGMKEMYFVPHSPAEEQMQTSFWNPTEDEFVSFILENSELNHSVCVGRTPNKRILYKLTA